MEGPMGPSFVIWVHELVFRELDPASFSEDFMSSRVMLAEKNMGSGSRVVEWSEKKRKRSLNDRYYNNGWTRKFKFPPARHTLGYD